VSALVDVVPIADRLRNAFKAHARCIVSRNDCDLNIGVVPKNRGWRRRRFVMYETSWQLG
jgi:hypothetical protein